MNQSTQIDSKQIIYDISYVVGKGRVLIHEKCNRIKRVAYDNPEMIAVFGPLAITMIGELWRNHQIRKLVRIVVDANGTD